MLLFAINELCSLLIFTYFIDLGYTHSAMNIRLRWCLCTLSILISLNAFSQNQETDSTTSATKSYTNSADTLVAQWVVLEKQNTHLKNQWQDTKRLLQQRITLLNQEQKQLTLLTTSNEQQVDEVSEARQKLLTVQTSMETKQADLSQWLLHQFAQVNNIHQQLPPPLAKSWQTKLSELHETDISKRLESLLNLYQTFDEFNQRVSTQQDTIIDQHGQEKMVHQLYLGVARGWYVTLDGTAAYGGIPTANGWQWQYDIPVSPQIIKDALAMLAHKKEAHLITLPMSLTSLETVGQ